MMETARIRRAGYPVRHVYREFVERYRYLATNIGPAQKIDCKVAAKRICDNVLTATCDYQFGHTKIFLKDAQDIFLESERSRIYLKYILIIQRGFRRVLFRRWIRKYRNAAITIQKNWRARGYRTNFLTIRQGMTRLQACIKSRQLAHSFAQKRKRICGLQAHCRGYLTRKHLKGKLTEKSRRMQELIMLRHQEEKEFRRAGNPNWEDDAKVNFMARFAELSREYVLEREQMTNERSLAQQKRHYINIEEDNKVVDDVFEFLHYSTSPENETNRNSIGVSKMLLYFEEKSKLKKKVPTKLLSRPVNFYTYETYESRL